MHASYVFFGVFLSCVMTFGMWGCLTSRWKLSDDPEMNAIAQVVAGAMAVVVLGLATMILGIFMGGKGLGLFSVGVVLGAGSVTIAIVAIAAGKIVRAAVTRNFDFKLVNDDQCHELFGPVAVIGILSLVCAFFVH